MDTIIIELQARIHGLQEQIEKEYDSLCAEFVQQRQDLAHRFLEAQQRHKVGLWRYLRGSRLPVVLTAPLVYVGWFAFAGLDVFVSLYKAVCFPIYGIPMVRRSEYLVFVRADLPYLNPIENFICLYCSYGYGALWNAKSGYELTWSRPTWQQLRSYLMYFDGFGESLLDYDHRSKRCGIGPNDYLEAATP